MEDAPSKLLDPCKKVVAHLFDLIKNPVTGRIERSEALEYLERSLNKKIQTSDKEYTELMIRNISIDERREGHSGINLEGFEKYIVSRCSVDKKDNSKKDVAIFRQLKYDGIKKNLKFFSDEEIT